MKSRRENHRAEGCVKGINLWQSVTEILLMVSKCCLLLIIDIDTAVGLECEPFTKLFTLFTKI